jgi:hypothetical protein
MENMGASPLPGTRAGGRPVKVRGGTMGGNMRTGMGMGIPQNAPTGGGMPAQYGRGYAAPFGDMGMGIPQNAPTGGGMPAQYARGPQAAGIEHRGTKPAPGTRAGGRPAKVRGGTMGGDMRSGMGMGIPQNAPTGGGMPAQYARGTAIHNTPVGAAAGNPVTTAAGGDIAGAGGRVARGGTTSTRKPIMKSFKNNKALMFGAGAAVIAGLAMNRRGEGTSSGRSGMTRY